MIKYFFATLVLVNLCLTSTKAQERKLYYDVIRNGKVIGNINFVEIVSGQKTFYSMNSDVKTRVLFSFSDNTSETAAYDNGILMYSSFYQKQTGSGEVTKTTLFIGKGYKITNKDGEKIVNFNPIRFGMLKMYVNVPDTFTKIYSGNYQQLLDLKKLGENRFQLTMPDGKTNTYTYKNGICTKVEIVRSLVSLQFVLRDTK